MSSGYTRNDVDFSTIQSDIDGYSMISSPNYLPEFALKFSKSGYSYPDSARLPTFLRATEKIQHSKKP